jgi:hypothetical protein
LMNEGGQDARRTETLLTGARVLRRRRGERRTTRMLAFVGIIALAALCVQRWTVRQAPVLAEAPKGPSSTSASAQVRYLSDDELLALFPDTPVGLATVQGGKKRLIFPRPGDEARFITRL